MKSLISFSFVCFAIFGFTAPAVSGQEDPQQLLRKLTGKDFTLVEIRSGKQWIDTYKGSCEVEMSPVFNFPVSSPSESIKKHPLYQKLTTINFRGIVATLRYQFSNVTELREEVVRLYSNRLDEDSPTYQLKPVSHSNGLFLDAQGLGNSNLDNGSYDPDRRWIVLQRLSSKGETLLFTVTDVSPKKGLRVYYIPPAGSKVILLEGLIQKELSKTLAATAAPTKP